jgi:hypothetical protein
MSPRAGGRTANMDESLVESNPTDGGRLQRADAGARAGGMRNAAIGNYSCNPFA